MQLNSPDAAIQEVIGTDSRAVVATVWLFDDSAYATGVRRYVEELIAPRFRSVIRLGVLEMWKDATDPLFAAGFQLAIQPLTLMAQIPGVCFWIGEDSEARTAAITRNITAFDQAHPSAFYHVVMVLGADLQRARAMQALLQEKGAVVLVAPDGAVTHSVYSLAQASAAYGYTVWCRYWEHPERNLVKAMWRSPGEGVISLGLSVARVEVEYHTKRWEEKLCWDQWQRWLKPQRLQSGSQLTTVSLVELLRHLLPGWYLTFTEESKLPRLPIATADERSMIAYRAPAEKLTSNDRWHRGQFRQWMVRLRGHVDFLGFVALANCRRFLERRSRSLFALVTSPLRTFLSLPSVPEGMLGEFRRRLQLCISYARTLAQVRVGDEAQPRTSFEQDWKVAARRVSSIPHLAGALARCGLIAIGLAWLVLGPWVWLGITTPLTDQWLFYVTLASAVVLGLSIIGIVGHHYYASLVAAKSIERASRNAEVRHLAGVGALAIDKVRGTASELQKQLERRAEELEQFEDDAKKQASPVGRDAATVGADNLSVGAVDRLIEPEFDAMRGRVYANLREKLSTPQNHQFIEFDYQRWQSVLAEAAGSVAREQVSRLHYEDCAAAETDSDSRLSALLSNLVKEGGSPALPGVPVDPCASVVLFGRRELWEPHRGQHDQIGFYPLRCRDLLLLSVHTIPT